MNKLFLMTSDEDKEATGDVIIVLDKILSMRVYQYKSEEVDKFAIVIDYNHEDSVVSKHSSKETCVLQLKKLIVAMGGEASMVEELTFIDVVTNRPDAGAQLLKALLK